MAQGVVLLLIYLLAMAYLVAEIGLFKEGNRPATSPPVSARQAVLRKYHVVRESTDLRYRWNCEKQYCSWRQYVSNELYESNHSAVFRIDEAEDVNISQQLDPRDPNLTCIPTSFGYTREQADRLFPWVGYPSCENKTRVRSDVLEIDQENGVLKMNCDGGRGWYFLGNQQGEELLGAEKYSGQKHEYPGSPVPIPGIEWAYGTCDRSRETLLEGASYRLLPNPDVISRVKLDMIKHQNAAKYKYGETETRPLTVIMLVLDSVSRKHFYRKLNQTVGVLNGLEAEKFRVFDFKMHNVMGDNSIPNLFPTWAGRPIHPQTEANRIRNQSRKEDLIGEAAIWAVLKDKGFVTMFLAEFCDNYFASAIGRKPKVDHLAQRFWCAAERFSGFK